LARGADAVCWVPLGPVPLALRRSETLLGRRSVPDCREETSPGSGARSGWAGRIRRGVALGDDARLRPCKLRLWM